MFHDGRFRAEHTLALRCAFLKTKRMTISLPGRRGSQKSSQLL
jgi:hypothetical protein